MLLTFVHKVIHTRRTQSNYHDTILQFLGIYYVCTILYPLVSFLDYISIQLKYWVPFTKVLIFPSP